MKKKIRKLKQLNRRIRECEDEIEITTTLPFYATFGKEPQRATDLEALRLQLSDLRAQKLTLLDKLEQKIINVKLSHGEEMGDGR